MLANNNITYTDNYNLPIIDDTQDQCTWRQMRNLALGSGNDSLVQKLDGLLKDFDDRLDVLEYVPIVINTFTNSVNTAEIGSTVSSVNFTYSINKVPTTLTLDSIDITGNASSYTLSNQTITANKTFTLVAGDDTQTSQKTTTISFYNGVYYGVATDGTIDNAFILALTKTLQSSKAKTFTVNAGAGQYIWYAVPTRYGTCSFNVGGFDGGFTLKSTVSFTNASGYTENYYIYCSDNANLGSQTVKVS